MGGGECKGALRADRGQSAGWQLVTYMSLLVGGVVFWPPPHTCTRDRERESEPRV